MHIGQHNVFTLARRRQPQLMCAVLLSGQRKALPFVPQDAAKHADKRLPSGQGQGQRRIVFGQPNDSRAIFGIPDGKIRAGARENRKT
jgi:hypothetical protein